MHRSKVQGRTKTAAQVEEALAEEQKEAESMINKLKVDLKKYTDNKQDDNVLASQFGGMGI